MNKIVREFNCYRCRKPVRLTNEENHPGKFYHIIWINYREGYGLLCPSCSLNQEEFLNVGPYQNVDLTAR